VTKNDERTNAPIMSRAVQDRIGHELRQMYAELLRQPLPENLVASLRASAEQQTARQRLGDPVAAMDRENAPSTPPRAQLAPSTREPPAVKRA
jgi:hypothetical protein